MCRCELGSDREDRRREADRHHDRRLRRQRRGRHHDPRFARATILFSTKGTQLTYAGKLCALKVALRNSAKYLTVVGEFDHAVYAGNRLGDDILLFYGAKPYRNASRTLASVDDRSCDPRDSVARPGRCGTLVAPPPSFAAASPEVMSRIPSTGTRRRRLTATPGRPRRPRKYREIKQARLPPFATCNATSSRSSPWRRSTSR